MPTNVRMSSKEKMSVGALAFLNGYGNSSDSDDADMSEQEEEDQPVDPEVMARAILDQILNKLQLKDSAEAIFLCAFCSGTLNLYQLLVTYSFAVH